MGEADRRNDIEKLLADAEAALGAGSPPAQARPPAAGENTTGVLVRRMRFAALAGATTAAAVWLLFALLPFLGATSGAAGAFLATFVALVLLRRR